MTSAVPADSGLTEKNRAAEGVVATRIVRYGPTPWIQFSQKG